MSSRLLPARSPATVFTGTRCQLGPQRAISTPLLCCQSDGGIMQYKHYPGRPPAHSLRSALRKLRTPAWSPFEERSNFKVSRGESTQAETRMFPTASRLLSAEQTFSALGPSSVIRGESTQAETRMFPTASRLLSAEQTFSPSVLLRSLSAK